MCQDVGDPSDGHKRIGLSDQTLNSTEIFSVSILLFIHQISAFHKIKSAFFKVLS